MRRGYADLRAANFTYLFALLEGLFDGPSSVPASRSAGRVGAHQLQDSPTASEPAGSGMHNGP